MSRYIFNKSKLSFCKLLLHSIKSSWLLLISLAMISTGCTSLPQNNSKKSYSIVAPSSAKLSKLASDKTPIDTQNSSFIFLNDGTDAFIARMALASKAETSIDAQYYIWKDDITGNLLINELIKSAERGVRVRLLVDDIDASYANDKALALIASYPTVSVRVFNPFSRYSSKYSQFFTRFGDVTRRMHNKSFVVDGQVSIIGGRNIGDEYFGANSHLAFSDLDVLSIGPIVSEVASVYDLYWNSPLAYPIELLHPEVFDAEYINEKQKSLSDFALAQQDSAFADKIQTSAFFKQLVEDSVSFLSGEVELMYDLPEKISSSRHKTELSLVKNLIPHMNNISEELIIISPYFVPEDKGIEFLLSLIEKGVQVKILTNSLASTDVSIVHAGYKSSRKKLLKGGVEIYEMKGDPRKMSKREKLSFGSSRASLHTKTFIIDRNSLFVGSLNIDPRSIKENTEIGMLIHCKDGAQILSHNFDTGLKNITYKLTWDKTEKAIKWSSYNNGTLKTYTHDPDTSWWLRRWVDLLSLLPIESQL